MIQSFTPEQLENESALVYNPKNGRDKSEYDVFLDNKNGLLNLGFNPKENQKVQSLIQSLINIDHENKTLTMDITGVLRVVTITQEILDSIVQAFESSYDLVVGQIVTLTGNSRLLIVRNIISELTADLGYALIINPIEYKEVENFTPLSMITEQTRDNSGVPMRFSQTAQAVQDLIDYHEPRIEASNAKEKAGKLNAWLINKTGLSSSTIFAIKNFLGFPDFLKDLANENRITVDNAARIVTICNSKNYRTIDPPLGVMDFLRICLVHTGDPEKGVVTEKHIKVTKAGIDEDNGFGKKPDPAVVPVDPTGEPTEQEEKKTSAKALEGQRLRGLTVEQLNEENNELAAALIDPAAEYLAARFSEADKIKHNSLMRELLESWKCQTVAQKALTKAQQEETQTQDESQVIPVEFVEDAAEALTALV